MAYNPRNANGQATMANSTPVVVASDQSAIPVTGSATGAAVPANAFYIAGIQSGTTLTGATIIAPNDSQGSQNGLYTTSALEAYNGTNFDRLRTISAASGAGASTGILAVAAVVWDGSNYRRMVGDSSGNVGVIARTATTGGATSARVASAASTNATSTKTSAGTVYGWSLYNTSASAKYFKFYNKASAPTVGTDTPVFTMMLPAGGGSNISLSPTGWAFATGIAYAVTGGVADSDTTNTAANDVVGIFLYA